jgi:hypothetical protein
VAEMDAALKHRLHGNNCHFFSFCPVLQRRWVQAWDGLGLAGVHVPLRDA